jgi:hypothetical protein
MEVFLYDSPTREYEVLDSGKPLSAQPLADNRRKIHVNQK